MSDTPVSLQAVPEGYAEWLVDLKGRIHSAQQRAARAVNRERLCGSLAHAGNCPTVWWTISLGPQIESLREPQQTSLPSIEQIERELRGGEA